MNTKQLFEQFSKLSLKRVCDTVNVCYQYALKLSKSPIKGEVYDASKINYDELDRMFSRKNINLDEYDWKTINDETIVHEPINPLTDFEVGVEFTIRNVQSYCQIVFINRNDEDDSIIELIFKDYDTNKCRVMSADTFMHQSPRILSK
jgi:hypothetical protein